MAEGNITQLLTLDEATGSTTTATPGSNEVIAGTEPKTGRGFDKE